MNDKKRIAYVTGSRADFGLMGPVLEAIERHPDLSLQVYVAGEHLSPVHGETAQQVRAAFPSAIFLDAPLEGDTPEHQARFTAALHHALTEQFASERPYALVLLGDRPEMLVAATVGTYLRIPVAHLHGGELTQSVDNAARFAVSRLAHLHLPATQAAADRLTASGEEPSSIRLVGAPGIDRILHTPLPTREEIFRRLNIDPKQQIILVTQHPATETAERAEAEMRTVLEAVDGLDKIVVVTHPHLDPGGSKMLSVIRTYGNRADFRLVPSLEYADFLALARESWVWVGNSSAGMIESASLGVPVVNVGGRQTGREYGENVMNVPLEGAAILSAIRTVTAPAFRARLSGIRNPWGDGGTGPRVADMLATTDFSRLLHKKFIFPV